MSLDGVIARMGAGECPPGNVPPVPPPKTPGEQKNANKINAVPRVPRVPPKKSKIQSEPPADGLDADGQTPPKQEGCQRRAIETNQIRGTQGTNPSSLEGIPTAEAEAETPVPPAVMSLALGLAAQSGLSVQSCLCLVADEPTHALIAAGDEATLRAWEWCAKWHGDNGLDPAAYLDGRGRLKPQGAQAGKPKPDTQGPASVRCCDCAHAKPTSHPALTDCLREVQAPGCVGEFTWWKTDQHACNQHQPNGA